MLTMRTKVAPSAFASNAPPLDSDEEDSEAEPDKFQGKLASHVKKLPGWSHMPLLGLLTIILLMACMLPM